VQRTREWRAIPSLNKHMSGNVITYTHIYTRSHTHTHIHTLKSILQKSDRGGPLLNRKRREKHVRCLFLFLSFLLPPYVTQIYIHTQYVCVCVLIQLNKKVSVTLRIKKKKKCMNGGRETKKSVRAAPAKKRTQEGTMERA
jgi:hypothetical protein